MNDKVSIVMPAYNAADYIKESIESVRKQTFTNWELVVVDDCSTDNTAEIVKKEAHIDSRIKYYKLEENSGAAIARNKAVELTTGKYVAFLDSDDLWKENKLENQIAFMKSNKYTFTCTYYDKIDENSNNLNHIITYKNVNNYSGLLKDCPGNSTVIYDVELLGKTYIPNIKKRNDYLMWLKVIDKSQEIFCLKEVLTSHRIHSNSLSSDKKSLLRFHWKIYRKHEKLGIIKSTYLIIYWVIKTISKKKIKAIK